MNYQKIHDDLIHRARIRDKPPVCERHHIIPDHFFINRKRTGKKGWLQGDPDDKNNIVYLTPEEHFLVHQLLVKIYPGIISLVFALARMSSNSNIPNNKIFGWIRRRHIEAMSISKKSMSHDERCAVTKKMLETREGWSAEYKDALYKKISISTKNRYANMTLEQKESSRQNRSTAAKLAHRHNVNKTEEEKAEISKKLSISVKTARANYTDEQNARLVEKQKATKAARTPEQKAITNAKRAETFAKKTKEEIEETNRQRNETHAKRRKQLMRSTDSDKE